MQVYATLPLTSSFFEAPHRLSRQPSAEGRFTLGRVRDRTRPEQAPLAASEFLAIGRGNIISIAKLDCGGKLWQRVCVSVASNEGKGMSLFALRIIEERNHVV